MSWIYLTNGGYAIVDDKDYEYLSQWNWQENASGYAVRTKKIANRKYTSALMHREIMSAKKGEFLDHVNHNKLDNRRSNLRLCTLQENNWNKPKQNNNSSGYVGVTRQRNKWKSYIYFDNQRIHLAEGDDPEELAYIRDQVALQLFGEFAYTNFSL